MLAVDAETRRWTPGYEASSVFARVRVRGGMQTGWTFVRFAELSAACSPLADVQPSLDLGARLQEMQRRARLAEFVRPGAFRTRNGPIRCGWGPHDEVVEGFHLPGWGTLEVLRLSRELPCLRADRLSGDYEGANVVRWRTDAGWRAAFITERISPDRPWRPGASYDGALRIGSALYFRTLGTSGRRDRNCLGPPERVEHDDASLALSRLHPTGVVVEVFRARTLLGDRCAWETLPGESLRVVCDGGRRVATLRWDAATFQLVPLREGLPTFTGTWVCRQEWEDDNGR